MGNVVSIEKKKCWYSTGIIKRIKRISGKECLGWNRDVVPYKNGCWCAKKMKNFRGKVLEHRFNVVDGHCWGKKCYLCMKKGKHFVGCGMLSTVNGRGKVSRKACMDTIYNMNGGVLF